MSKDRNIVKTALAETMFFYKRSFVPLAFDTVLQTLLVSLVIFACAELFLFGHPILSLFPQINTETLLLMIFAISLALIAFLFKNNARLNNASIGSEISLSRSQKIVLFAYTSITLTLSIVGSIFAGLSAADFAKFQFCQFENTCFTDSGGNKFCTLKQPQVVNVVECGQVSLFFFQIASFLCLLFLLHLTQVLKIIIRQTFHQKNTLSRPTLKQSDL